MIVHDISRIIPDEVTTWPGDPLPMLSQLRGIGAGDAYTLHAMACSAHCGTHLDAPAHFIAGGGDILSARLDDLLGDADVVRVGGGAVQRSDLAGACPMPLPRVLFMPEEPASDMWLTEDAASFLCERKVRLVGTTCMSIDAPDSLKWPAHKRLLEAGCCILENCKLDGVEPGRYFLVCTPLPWRGAEASPVRAILLDWSAGPTDSGL